MLNERDGANEITVFIHKSKRKCGRNMDSGCHIIGPLNALKIPDFFNNMQFKTLISSFGEKHQLFAPKSHNSQNFPSLG